MKSREVVVGTRAMYALGQLVLWVPERKKADITELRDLAGKNIRFIAIAPPKLARCGHASIEALQRANLWETLRPKVVYDSSINMVRQMAESGNAGAAFTAYSLVLHDQGTFLKGDPHLCLPLERALPRLKEARRFDHFYWATTVG